MPGIGVETIFVLTSFFFISIVALKLICVCRGSLCISLNPTFLEVVFVVYCLHFGSLALASRDTIALQRCGFHVAPYLCKHLLYRGLVLRSPIRSSILVGMPDFAQELIDQVVDHWCLEDPKGMKPCGLVSKRWLPRSRYHLFSSVLLDAQNLHSFVALVDTSSLPILEFVRHSDCVSRRSMSRV